MLITRVFKDEEKIGYLDLEAIEGAVRDSMHQVGGVLLEHLLNAQGVKHQSCRISCEAGHQAELVGYRSKKITTVVAPVVVTRAYYYCEDCQKGMIPRDQDLDIVKTPLSHPEFAG